MSKPRKARARSKKRKAKFTATVAGTFSISLGGYCTPIIGFWIDPDEIIEGVSGS